LLCVGCGCCRRINCFAAQCVTGVASGGGRCPW
jgi:hypothetical protein